MDKSQFLLDKNDLPQTKNGRFSVVIKYFATISLICIGIYAVLFATLTLWPMVLICAACAVFWAMILLLDQLGFSQAAFLAGILNSSAFSLVSTYLLGWTSGFYFTALLIVPIIFMNSNMRLLFKGILTSAIIALLLAVFFFSWGQNAFWVLDINVLYGLSALNLAITTVILSITVHFLHTTAADAEQALIHANKKLASLATTDPVTNLVNRRIILSRIEQEKERMQRGGKPFALIMLDVDHFKNINDQYGHGAGDFVLVNLAELITVSIRKQDEVARWGGDEFLVLLPETDLEGGNTVAEKIRSRINTVPFYYRDTLISVTATFGVGVCEPNSGIGSVIRKADQALYQGKQSGRDRIILTSQG
jgi:diguanylate cyclase (GGDEF)-like protein